MNVVVIGNGPSLLGRKLGKVIDSHDVIVRFNFFKTGQFAEDVGKRTTIWFNNRDASPPTIRVMLNEHRFEEIHLHTWVKTEQAVNSFREVLAETGLETPVYGVEKSVISEMREFLGLPYSFFSTGAIGAWMMLKKHAKIKLTGFDWWDSPARMHYFQDREPFPDPAKGHQPMTEKIFFEKLIEMGRIEFI